MSFVSRVARPLHPSLLVHRVRRLSDEGRDDQNLPQLGCVRAETCWKAPPQSATTQTVRGAVFPPRGC